MASRNWLREYCEKTTSHCTEYFVMKHRSLIEKCYWLLTFFLMMYFTFITMQTILNIWFNNPSIMFIENQESEIQDIPFPLITICPSNQMRTWVWNKYKISNTSYWKKIEQYRSLVCSLNYYSLEYDNFYHAEYFDHHLIRTFLKDCAISCSEVFQSSEVKWQNITVQNVCQYVQPMLSQFGMCYTINMLPAYQLFNDKYYRKYMNFFPKNNSYVVTEKTKWNLDDGYSSFSNDALLIVNPLRTHGVTYYNSLSFTLNTFSDKFLNCPNQNLIGGFFVITVSNPTEYCSFKSRSFIVPDTETKIQIIPNVKKISSDLMWRSLDLRKCYLHNERKLFIFQHYSQHNCDSECVINETISTCGCIRFEWAFLATPGIKICGPAKLNCVKTSLLTASRPEMQNKCKCLQTCSVLEYDVLDSSDYNNNWNHLKSSKLSNNHSRGAYVEIVFSRPYFTAYKSSSIIDLDSLISIVGGVVSLLLGINLINFFEILYIVLQIVINYFMQMFNRNNR